MSNEDIIIILSTHIVGDISSTCRQMALLNRGELKFTGSPDQLIEKAKGHVYRIKAFESDLDVIKSKYPVISTIPSDAGWDVDVVADETPDYSFDHIDPNLEHAYMYFMEYVLGETSVVDETFETI
jgi:ABC-type multidrug transport system ATPase subunit